MTALEKTCVGYVISLTKKCGECIEDEQKDCLFYLLSPLKIIENKFYEQDWNEKDREDFNECYMVKFGVSKPQIEKLQNTKGFFCDEKNKWYRIKNKFDGD